MTPSSPRSPYDPSLTYMIQQNIETEDPQTVDNGSEGQNLEHDDFELKLQYLPENLKNDPEIIQAAILQNGFPLQYANQNVRMNNNVILAAIRHNGNGDEIEEN